MRTTTTLIKDALLQRLLHPIVFVKLNFGGCLGIGRLLNDHFGTVVKAFSKSVGHGSSP